MSRGLREFLAVFGTLWFLWLVQAAYLLRHRYAPARTIVNFIKALYRKPEHPDSLVRDWLILMYIIAGFFGTLATLSYFAEQ